jgi:hypothetical protein
MRLGKICEIIGIYVTSAKTINEANKKGTIFFTTSLKGRPVMPHAT